jgi:hypothetical protein
MIPSFVDMFEGELFTRMTRMHTLTPVHLRMAAAVILDIVYGYQAEEEKDELVSIVEKAALEFSQTIMPGQHLVDVFPWRE